MFDAIANRIVEKITIRTRINYDGNEPITESESFKKFLKFNDIGAALLMGRHKNVTTIRIKHKLRK